MRESFVESFAWKGCPYATHLCFKARNSRSLGCGDLASQPLLFVKRGPLSPLGPWETARFLVGRIAAIKLRDDLARMPNGDLLLPPDSLTVVHRDLVITLAARHRLPAVYGFRVFVTDGGLMSYGIDPVGMYRQAASYVDRILRDANPTTCRWRRQPNTKRR